MADTAITTNSDEDIVSVSAFIQFLLLCFASILVTGCAALTLFFNAVPKLELATVLFAMLYTQAVNFIKIQPPPSPSTTTTKTLRTLVRTSIISRLAVRILIFSSLVLSIIFPWIWLAFFKPNEQQSSLLGPHLFLMMTQVLFEIWSNRNNVSSLIRVGIPVAFAAYRLNLLYDWVYKSWNIYHAKGNQIQDGYMVLLASSNFIFWCFILFYVLLLKVIPPYFTPKSYRRVAGPTAQQKLP